MGKYSACKHSIGLPYAPLTFHTCSVCLDDNVKFYGQEKRGGLWLKNPKTKQPPPKKKKKI